MLTLDGETHTYRLDGKEITRSVSSVLVDAGLVETKWFTEQGRLNGQRRHLICQYDGDRDLDETTVDPADLPYLQARRAFIEHTKWMSLYVEQPIYSQRLDCAGCPDDIGFFPNDPYFTILDWKMGCEGVAAIQTAGYSILYDHHFGFSNEDCRTRVNEERGRAIGRCALLLRQNGTFRYQKYHIAHLIRDQNRFLWALGQAKRKEKEQ